MNALQNEFLYISWVIFCGSFFKTVQKTCQPDKLGLRGNLLLIL